MGRTLLATVNQRRDTHRLLALGDCIDDLLGSEGIKVVGRLSLHTKASGNPCSHSFDLFNVGNREEEPGPFSIRAGVETKKGLNLSKWETSEIKSRPGR